MVLLLTSSTKKIVMAEWSRRDGPTELKITLGIFVRIEKRGREKKWAKNWANGPFISPRLPSAPFRAAGQRWPGQCWLGQTQQKKKILSFLLSHSSETCLENISTANAIDRSSQVKSTLNPWIVSTRKSRGQQNSKSHSLSNTSHCTLHSRYQIKIGQLLIPYFVYSRFAC